MARNKSGLHEMIFPLLGCCNCKSVMQERERETERETETDRARACSSPKDTLNTLNNFSVDFEVKVK